MVFKQPQQYEQTLFFLQLLSGPESSILESDWLIARPAFLIWTPSMTAPKFPTLTSFQRSCFPVSKRKMKQIKTDKQLWISIARAQLS